MQKLISEIIIGERCRKDMGDIASLANSIDSIGLLHPVVVDKADNLIAGERRIRAFEKLGRKKIPVTVVDLAEIVRGEYAENAIREPFQPSEVFAIYEAAGPVEIAAAKAKMAAQAEQGKKGGRGKKKPLQQIAVGVSDTEKPKRAKTTVEKVGGFAGVSGRTLQKIIAVMEATRSEPERFADLPAKMNKSVNSAFRHLTKARDEARVLTLVQVPGKFSTLVIDPPWDYEWLSLAGRAAPGYATMTHEELLALDVAQWAGDDCMMYLWVTNNFMTRGCDLMAKWGWQHKTVLTWVKPRIGLGSYFRNTTEHILVGTRGNAKTRRDDMPTHFEAPMGEHSEKPEKFYETVRAASYPGYGEIFQRAERPDFKNLYQTKVMQDAAEAAA
jgi:N6-adenosine-specific RNA methylase IME4